MSPIERWDPETGQLVERRSHPMTPWATAAATIMFGAVAYFGGAIAAGVAGGGSPHTPVQGAADPPQTPSLTVVVLPGDTAAYPAISAFSGSGGDTLTQTIVQWDTVTGDFASSPIAVDTVNVPQLRDTVGYPTGVFGSGGVYKARVQHVGGLGGASAFSTVDTFTATYAAAEVPMFCDWRNATDSVATPAAIEVCTAAGDLNRTSGENENAYVVDSSAAALSGKGWPAQKALKVWNYNGAQFSGVQLMGSLPNAPWNRPTSDTIVPGESEWRRIYMLFDVADSVVFQGIHPVETWDNNGEFALEFKHQPNDPKIEMFYYIYGAGYIYDLVSNGANVLPKDTVLRFEWEFRRTAVDSMTLHARVYVWNGSGFTLRYDDNDYVLRNSHDGGTGGTTTLADSLPHHVPVFYSTGGPDGYGELYTFKVGVNGWDCRAPEGCNPEGFDFMYQGAWALCRHDWCGAYPIAGVEN